MTKSISYPIAKTTNGQWVHIDDAQHGNSYYCPECESPFVARLGSINTHHFAHKPNYTGVCTGESGYHSLAKHLLAYHFTQEGHIHLESQCATCGREYSEEKKVINVEVEKGQDDSRPDVRLLMEGNITIDCEIVYKNPLGEKLNIYRDRNSNLLIWSIKGQVDKVPPLTQYSWHSWLEFEERRWIMTKMGKTEYLLLLTSPPPQHICTPYGTAYIIQTDCYKCHRKTKIAILSEWYPDWGESGEVGALLGAVDIHYQIYNTFNSVPSKFVRRMNEKYGTKYFEDYSEAARKKYLMNHCTLCGAKFGDYSLISEISKDMESNNGDFSCEKVEIPFTLTEWEKGMVLGSD